MELACVAPGEEFQSHLLTSLLPIGGHTLDIPAQSGVTTSVKHGQKQGFSCRMEDVNCHKIQAWYPSVQGQAEQSPEEPDLEGAMVEGL